MKGTKGLDEYLRKVEEEEGRRIYRFLVLLEEDSVYDFGEQSPYEESVLSREVKQYFARIAEKTEGYTEASEEETEDFPLQRVYSVLQLDAFEQMCVKLALLGEVNACVGKFFVYMNNDWNTPYLTIDTAIKLYTMEKRADVGYYACFFEKSSLPDYIFEFYRQEGKNRGSWGLKLRDSFFRLLFSGKGSVPEDFPFLTWHPAEAGKALLREDSPVFARIDTLMKKTSAAVYLCGKEDYGKQIVNQYGRRNGWDICYLDLLSLLLLIEKNGLPITLRELGNMLFLWTRVQNACLCIYFCKESTGKREYMEQVIKRVLEAFPPTGSALFILGEELPDFLKGNPRIGEILTESGERTGDIRPWQETAKYFSVEETVKPEAFAAAYRFNAVQIWRIFQYADSRRLLDGRDAIQREDIKESCIREAGCRGNNLITVMHTGYQWEDLVLPERQNRQLKTACNRVLYRQQIYHTWGFEKRMAYGRGVSMVFSGPPGTGKTMSAGIVADALGTALYRVNLAAVVSKYIGETEKNLNVVFETVRKGQGVLFFDEADVLFSKRTEVQNSNDKHSNMEAAYLLQKMEEYEGIVILATNYVQNMDEAFKRRIQFWIEFPFPDETCRKRLWEKVFPEQMEFGEMPDYDFLAKHFELSGSQIKNIALQAAFFAADERRGADMGHIIRALLMEIRKTGKKISREDLREYYIYYENN
ncbi:MAG: ATP-binding protein [Bacteroidales bacterium]|nr:ATP-binding protein [Clostridium sp.]MCM1203304.1 ATP-binding protein [Bacteroidales bacterium]